MSGNMLTDLSGLGAPAKALIEKIADACGWIAAPYQVTRVAKAEAEAMRIKAMAEIEISEIQHRGLNRLIEVEGRKQKNVERIVASAASQLRSDSKPDELDPDWLTNFFEKCASISNAEMQSVWARILAGETNHSGSFSKRTLDTVSKFDKSDADLFTTLCRFNTSAGAIVFDVKSEVYKNNGLTFAGLKHLTSIGLVTFDHLAGYSLLGLPDQVAIEYFGRKLLIELDTKKNGTLDCGTVLLTNVGKQLATISGAKVVSGFPEYLKDQWALKGYTVTL